MEFEYLEKEGITKVTAETTDRCFLCDNFEDCPLLGALETNIVYPSAEYLEINECPMFKLVG